MKDIEASLSHNTIPIPTEVVVGSVEEAVKALDEIPQDSVVISDVDGVILDYSTVLRNMFFIEYFLGDGWLDKKANAYLKALDEYDYILTTNRALSKILKLSDIPHLPARLIFNSESLFKALQPESPDKHIRLCSGLNRQFGREGLPMVGHLGTTELGAWDKFQKSLVEVASNKIKSGEVKNGVLTLVLVSDTIGLQSSYVALKNALKAIGEAHPQAVPILDHISKFKKAVSGILGNVHLSGPKVGEDRFLQEAASIILDEVEGVTELNIQRISISTLARIEKFAQAFAENFPVRPAVQIVEH